MSIAKETGRSATTREIKYADKEYAVLFLSVDTSNFS